jgi:hypothetical protein
MWRMNVWRMSGWYWQRIGTDIWRSIRRRDLGKLAIRRRRIAKRLRRDRELLGRGGMTALLGPPVRFVEGMRWKTMRYFKGRHAMYGRRWRPAI